MDKYNPFIYQQEKRKTANRLAEVQNLNRVLQEYLRRTKWSNEQLQKHFQAVHPLMVQHVVSSSLWQLRYRINFESVQVACLQVLVIEEITKQPLPRFRNDIIRLGGGHSLERLSYTFKSLLSKNSSE